MESEPSFGDSYFTEADLILIDDPPKEPIFYFPCDTPWEQVADLEALKRQCRWYGAPDEGDVPTLQHRLKLGREFIQEFKGVKYEPRGALWRLWPDLTWKLIGMKMVAYRLIKVKDTSDVKTRRLEKQFTLYTRMAEALTVTISKDLVCDCDFEYPTVNHEKFCDHILFVLWHILRVPPPLLYQYAFLTTELEYMFAAIPYFYFSANNKILPRRVAQFATDSRPVCPVCFRAFPLESDSSASLVSCVTCGHRGHGGCFEDLFFARKPFSSDDQHNVCVLCLDEKEWWPPLEEGESWGTENSPGVEEGSQGQGEVKEEEEMGRGLSSNDKPLVEVKFPAMICYEVRVKDFKNT